MKGRAWVRGSARALAQGLVWASDSVKGSALGWESVSGRAWVLGLERAQDRVWATDRVWALGRVSVSDRAWASAMGRGSDPVRESVRGLEWVWDSVEEGRRSHPVESGSLHRSGFR